MNDTPIATIEQVEANLQTARQSLAQLCKSVLFLAVNMVSGVLMTIVRIRRLEKRMTDLENKKCECSEK